VSIAHPLIALQASGIGCGSGIGKRCRTTTLFSGLGVSGSMRGPQEPAILGVSILNHLILNASPRRHAPAWTITVPVLGNATLHAVHHIERHLQLAAGFQNAVLVELIVLEIVIVIVVEVVIVVSVHGRYSSQ
jgi:hypothetical protein